MYEHSDKDIKNALGFILKTLNRRAIPLEEREPLREDFTEIWPDLQILRSDAAYTSHVDDYIRDEYERRQNPDDDEEKREKPLCGCPSPTCPLRRGELPAAARTRHGSLIGNKTPEQAVANEIQTHQNPYVLREADRDWWETTSEPVAELLELEARAERLMNEYDGPPPAHV